MRTVRQLTSRRSRRHARAIGRSPWVVLVLALASATALWSTDAGILGDTPCQVPTASHPTLTSAIDDPTCAGAELASGDYAGPFRITRDFPISGPSDFSARLLGTLEVEGDTDVDVELTYVQVQVGVDPGLLFADDFESGTTSEWSSSFP